MLIQLNAQETIPNNPSWSARWEGPDQGLINAYKAGQALAKNNPKLAELAKAGELPLLPWKGGVEKATKTGGKLGSLLYVAAWQALRGEDLRIETDQEISLECTKSLQVVTFTLDTAKLLKTSEA